MRRFDKQLLIPECHRLLGGFLMVAVGVLYLLFEKSILADSDSTEDELASSSTDGLSRIILGLQVCTDP